MTGEEKEALLDIKGFARANRVFVGNRHAKQRMHQRRVQIGDIISALCGATECEQCPDGRWKVSGPDLDGDDLTLVVVVEDGVVVVTVY